MPTRRTVGGAVAGLLIALAVATALGGCGPLGDDDDELSREELIARGDEICSEGRERYAELQKNPPQSATGAADLTRALIDITRDEIDRLRDLNAPAESEDDLENYLASREAAVRVLEQGLQAAENEDAEAYAEAQAQIARQQVDRARLAEKVGFSECSRPLSGG